MCVLRAEEYKYAEDDYDEVEEEEEVLAVFGWWPFKPLQVKNCCWQMVFRSGF